ncbi:PLP-dependent transferase [Heliocybe sulcata]|uniref:PLP-dependent transferase n=1 Tax=Heliocybe sulcata TaxID=5364 RepID=A0A5C3MLC8_9AGAM|nr:PLP-dependent transferase [Heliocybe sulcata]
MASPLAFQLSTNTTSTRAPPIGQALNWARRYVPTANRPLLDISQGVPGTPPPPALRDALSAAASAPGVFSYGPDEGEYELRKAVADEMKWVYGGGDGGSDQVDIQPEDVSITSGCNLAFVSVAMCLAQQGDEFILPVPWYMDRMTLNLLGIKTVVLQTYPEDHFQPDPERCAKLITARTRAIVLVTPNNPTGATYPPSLISSFAALARSHNIALVIDETYRDFIATGPPHYLFHNSPSSEVASNQPPSWSWRSSIISLYSFSKSYCIPGHRLGVITASPNLLPSLLRIFDCLQICAPRGGQRAFLSKPTDDPDATSLLPSLRPFIAANRAALSARHELFRTHLPPRWHIASHGAYYAFVRHPFVGKDAKEVCQRLAQEIGVICLPVAFFLDKEGGELREEDRYVRFSVANVDDERITTVCERLREAEQAFGWELDG